MGSRIREALEISRDYIIDAINIRISTYGEAFRPHQLDEMKKDLSLVESEIALLTAEPEPCEDALSLVDKLEETHGMSCLTTEKKASMIDAYASQVADKRAEELREAIDDWGCKHDHPNILSEIDEALVATEPKNGGD